MTATDTSKPQGDADSKASSKMGLVVSVLLCLLGGALGFFGLSSELLPFDQGAATGTVHDEKPAMPDVAFVDIPTLIVALPPGATNGHLRFTGQIEVPAKYQNDVEHFLPRIQDAINGYLGALTVEDIEGPGALFKIRLHLFRRIVMVVGLGKANSLLVTEFILN
ncbi:flagellar basal body-associated FliL family protein [Marivita sp.]|uniref:flagellar basal body-associated FliL family protein n=1 Tax=Marivita sp. TaxID=2003365 RepID=UPI003F6B7EE3